MNVRTRLIGATLVCAALLVPVAQAEHPDDRAGLRGPGGIAAEQAGAAIHPDNRAEPRGPGAVASPGQPVAPIRPDDRGELRGPGAFASSDGTAAAHPDNRAEPRGPGAFETTFVRGSASDGFDWRDALLGGLGGMGLALAVTGLVVLLSSQRHRTRIA